MIKRFLNFYYLQEFLYIAWKTLVKINLDYWEIKILEKSKVNIKIVSVYISPIDPAVKPTTKKKVNSRRSRGREFTIRFN